MINLVDRQHRPQVKPSFHLPTDFVSISSNFP